METRFAVVLEDKSEAVAICSSIGLIVIELREAVLADDGQFKCNRMWLSMDYSKALEFSEAIKQACDLAEQHKRGEKC